MPVRPRLLRRMGAWALCLLAPLAQAAPSDAQVLRSAQEHADTVYAVLSAEFHLQNRQWPQAYALLMQAAGRQPDARLYARAAEVAMRANMSASALQAAQAWQRAFPQDPEACSVELQAMLMQQRIADSLRPLGCLIERAPDERSRLALIALIPTFYANVKFPVQALDVTSKALDGLVQQAATRQVALVTLARLRMQARLFADALLALQQAQEAPAPAASVHEPLSQQEWIALWALQLSSQARATDAASSQNALAFAMQGLLGLEAPSREALSDAISTLIAEKHQDQALALLRMLLQQQPNAVRAWLLQAALLTESKRIQEASASLQQYLRLRQQGKHAPQDPQDPRNEPFPHADTRAYALMAELADARGQAQAAAQWLGRIEDSALRTQALFARSQRLIKDHKVQQALQQLAAIRPSDDEEKVQLALHIAQAQQKDGQMDRALRTLDAALALLSDNADLLYARAMLREKAGDFAGFEGDMRRVIALQPASPFAYNALGYVLADRGLRLPEARALVERAIALKPDDAAIQDSVAWVYYRQGDLKQAREWLEKSFAADPQAEIAAHLGEVLWQLGQRERARDIWAQGLRIDPEDASLHETMRRLDPAQK